MLKTESLCDSSGGGLNANEERAAVTWQLSKSITSAMTPVCLC